ncbi:hypothetical protein [Hyalangium versicolor]|uniref:hypothetical protein n=1 Tax=Hyalangium versicolor TaxID=2861190 RepID=UPI001CCDDCD5|nr:hypothetical protein [Hyalangium versicolor]
MRLKNSSAFLLLVLGGCSGAEFSEPPMPPPSRDERADDEDQAPRELAGEARATGEDRPPVVMLSSPEEGARYQPGASITFEARATDPEDGGLPASAFTWKVDFHEGGKVYAFVPPISGMARGTFTAPAVEGAEGPRWYRIHLQVKDRHGNTSAVFRDVRAQEPSGDKPSPVHVR